MAKFCQNCGTPYEEGAVFCSNCGTNISGVPAPKVKKSAITVASLREVATKRMKAMMIIVLVVSLLIGLSTLTGSYEITTKSRYNGELYSVSEYEVKELYPEAGESEISGVITSAKVLNIIYGILLLGVAAMTMLAMLENACGGKGNSLFKKATVIAAIATFLFAILFVFLCRKKVEEYTYILCVPVSAWVNLVLFSSIAALNVLAAKEEA